VKGGEEVGYNSGKGYRHGAVRRRTQSQTPNGEWTKRDSDTGRFMDGAKEPFKGVRKEK